MELPNRFKNGDIVRYRREIIIRIDGVRRDEHGTLKYDITVLDDNFEPTTVHGASSMVVQDADRNSVLIQSPAGSMISDRPNGGRKSLSKLKKRKSRKSRKSRKTRRKRIIK